MKESHIETRCRHCHYLDPSHADACPTQPLETQVVGLKASVKGWQEDAARKERALASLRNLARFWEGKFHQVKRENNALRRKLYQENRKER